MAGFLFYWLTWSAWIYATFLLNKQNRYRFPVAMSLLILIILSPYSVPVVSYQLSVASCFLMVAGCAYFWNRRFSYLLYTGIRILIVTLATASFHMMSLFDPVWLFFDRHWMQGILFTGLSLILFTGFAERIFSTVIGFIQADFLYATLLRSWGIRYPVGSMEFFDSLALTLCFISLWSGLEFLQQSFQRNYPAGKEKPLS